MSLVRPFLPPPPRGRGKAVGGFLGVCIKRLIPCLLLGWGYAKSAAFFKNSEQVSSSALLNLPQALAIEQSVVLGAPGFEVLGESFALSSSEIQLKEGVLALNPTDRLIPVPVLSLLPAQVGLEGPFSFPVLSSGSDFHFWAPVGGFRDGKAPYLPICICAQAVWKDGTGRPHVLLQEAFSKTYTPLSVEPLSRSLTRLRLLAVTGFDYPRPVRSKGSPGEAGPRASVPAYYSSCSRKPTITHIWVWDTALGELVRLALGEEFRCF